MGMSRSACAGLIETNTIDVVAPPHALALGGASTAPAPVAVYPVASIYPASTDYTLAVNGTSVPVTKYAGYDIAQFALGTGTATMAVKMTSHSSASTSSQVWVTPLRGFWPSAPMTAWVSSVSRNGCTS